MNYLKLTTGLLAMTWASIGLAGPVTLNTTNGSINDIFSFDWLPGTSYTIGASQADIQNGDFLSSYIQGSLGNLIDDNGQSMNNLGLNTDYEVTFVAGFREQVFGINNAINPVTGQVTQNANFASTNDPLNFFQVWYDTNVNNNPLAGTGFNDGILIASGTILPGGGGNISSTFAFSGDVNDPVSTDPNDYVALDQFGVNNWIGTNTNLGIGGSLFNARADFLDQSVLDIGDPNSLLDIRFNAVQKLAFNETNPARLFVDENGNLQSVDLGTINGINGDGVALQVDGNSSFDVTTVPIPASIWLFMAGLTGFALIGRKPKTQA